MRGLVARHNVSFSSCSSNGGPGNVPAPSGRFQKSVKRALSSVADGSRTEPRATTADEKETGMGQKVCSDGWSASLENVVITLKAQLKILDEQECWLVSAYLDRTISALENELQLPSVNAAPASDFSMLQSSTQA